MTRLSRRTFLQSGALGAVVAAAPPGPAVAQVADAPDILRRFVDVGGRQMAYLRAGNGPPLVLLHAYPGSAMMMRRHIERHAGRFTCFTFETPGMGYSDPLPGPLTVTDVADAVADAMRALGLGPSVLFGVHSGAVVATELASRHPDLVCGLVTDGLPLIEEAGHGGGFDGYFKPFVPDMEGTHFTWAWSRFRDQFIFYPWNDRRRQAIRDDVVGFIEQPIGLHQTVMAMCLGADYVSIYRSAVFYGQRGVAAVGKVIAPAAFLESADDITFSLDLMPPLRPGQSKHRVPADPAAKTALIRDSFARFTGTKTAPADRNPIDDGPGIRRHFVSLGHGDMLLRHRGTSPAKPILLIHDAPGSGLALEPLIAELGKTRRVIAFDLPGCGGSDPLPGSAPDLDAFADALIAACHAIGVDMAQVYGTGFGASVAIALARRSPLFAAGLWLHGVALPDPAERRDLLAHYAPEMVIGRDGAHWYATWLMLRDSELFWPWYRTDKAHMRKADVDLGAQRLHDWTVDVMRQEPAYHHLPNAALASDAAQMLRGVQAPVTIVQDAGHRMSVYDVKLVALLPAAARADAKATSVAAILGNT